MLHINYVTHAALLLCVKHHEALLYVCGKYLHPWQSEKRLSQIQAVL